MDPRLIRYYDEELRHLAEMGEEFARLSPKAAARLGMTGTEVSDPYVERLREGVAFLAARVHLKLDAEFPRFTHALLEIVHPHYLAPTPSMVIVQLAPELGDPSLGGGNKVVPRGTAMQSVTATDKDTPCEFRTAHDVTLWPIEVVSASYFSFAPDLPLNALPYGQRVRGGVRIRLKVTAGLTFARTAIDRLRFFVAGLDPTANRLHELCLAAPLGAMVVSPKAKTPVREFLPATCVRGVGFDDNEALLPVSARSFQGYRLLHEHFAFPQRSRFFEVTGLAPALSKAAVDDLELVLLFGRGESGLEGVVDRSYFALNCTPAINLFSRRADRINLTESDHEHHLVVDRTRPRDFEVFSVESVVGHGVGVASERRFLPFYQAYGTHDMDPRTAYFTVRREPRLISTAERRQGSRSSYVGNEVFLSLVDPVQAPFSGHLRQLAVDVVCSNRDLVLLLPFGQRGSDFQLEVAAPVTAVRVVAGPSRPRAPLVDGAACWRAISHLSLNYLALVDSSPDQGAGALRELLQLYADPTDAGTLRQIEALRSVAVERIVRRLPGAGPLAFGRGLQVAVTVDERAYGDTPYQLGAVLSRYFARHVSMNSFTETVLRSETRGEVSRWMPEPGARPTL